MGKLEYMGLATFEEARQNRDLFEDYLQPVFDWDFDDEDSDDAMEGDYHTGAAAEESEVMEDIYEEDDEENDGGEDEEEGGISLALRMKF